MISFFLVNTKRMKTWAIILISIIIIVVIAVIAWLVFRYHNSSGGGGGGGNGPLLPLSSSLIPLQSPLIPLPPVPDNFSSLYRKLQPLIKTMFIQVNTMSKWLNELERTRECRVILVRAGLTSLYGKFESKLTNLNAEATLPVSTIYNSTYEILLCSSEEAIEAMTQLGDLVDSGLIKGAFADFCHTDWAKNFVDAGKEVVETLAKIDAIIVEMVKIARKQ